MLIDYKTDPKIWDILDRVIPMLSNINKESPVLKQLEDLRMRIKTTSEEPPSREDKNLLYNTLRIYRLGFRLLEQDTSELDKLIELVLPNSMNFIFDED